MTGVLQNLTDTPQVAQNDPKGQYRFDIDGLRALAIALVVLYHVWFGRVSGGVDVFLMISAFFMTASLVRRATRGESPGLGRYWVNRFRRLMPAAAVTILGILITAYLLYPNTEWPRIWRESWASIFYFQNWELALGSVDYYNLDGNLQSPLQHFWSLSIQGQVFILFPIVIALIAWLLHKRPTWVRPVLIIVFTIVFAVSLWWSIVSTQANQEFAYFDTRTRIWEFAAGAIVALLLPYLRVPAIFAAVLGWVGVAGVITCGLVLDVQGGFPGYLALWPVLCTAAIIIGGTNQTAAGPSRMLSSKPMRWVGKDAYALYLVHWPVLITWRALRDNAAPDFWSGSLIIALSLVLARVLRVLVDAPVQRLPRPSLQISRGLLVIATSIAIVAAPLGLWQKAENDRIDALVAQYEADAANLTDPVYPGAAALFAGVAAPNGVPIIPHPARLEQEWVRLDEDCQGKAKPQSDLIQARCRQTVGADEAERTVLIMGDSRVQQLTAPVEAIAEAQGLGIVRSIFLACPIGLAEPPLDLEWMDPKLCQQWREAALDYALQLRPDIVYLVVTTARFGEPERLQEGIEDVIDPLLDAGITVVAVRSNPRFAEPGVALSPFECATSAADAANECVTPQADVLAVETSPLDELDERVVRVDFTPWFCPDGQCPAVIGNMAVYFDTAHVTKTYGRTLGPVLEQQLIGAGVLTEYSGLVPRDDALGGLTDQLRPGTTPETSVG